MFRAVCAGGQCSETRGEGAAAYGSCGREDEARATAAEVLRIGPEISVEAYARHLKFRDEDKELVIDGLRKSWRK
jgi:hypothetical protein